MTTDRYLVALVPHPDDPSLMIAYVAMPPNQMERGDVVDGFGKVLDHIA